MNDIKKFDPLSLKIYRQLEICFDKKQAKNKKQKNNFELHCNLIIYP
jgi:hypothetical protein